MINPQVKIHDNYSFEFKTGFVPDNDPQEINEFKINTWLFLPNSLDINRDTYDKNRFYRDVKTYLRLITPTYTLRGILDTPEGPLFYMQKAIESLAAQPGDAETIEHYTSQVKMFSCIMKSALRDEAVLISKLKSEDEAISRINEFASLSWQIVLRYRGLYDLLKEGNIPDKEYHTFLFGDEFVGNVIEQHAYFLMKKFKGKEYYDKIMPILTGLMGKEDEHKRKMGFNLPVEGNEEHNKLLIIKRNILKKFVESDLYLQTIKKKDGAFAEQVLYSIAAGIAMIFATLVTFFATQRYGNFTMDLFVILVISYMFKDRIKEVTRYYFTSHMSRKYFDNKRRLKIRNQEIGWTKEAFDFMPETKVPEEILNMRNRSPLVEAENEAYGEKVILYRKLVHLSLEDIEKYNQYHVEGINDITVFNIMHFIRKTDDPTLTLYLPDEENGFKETTGSKEYPLYIILSCESNKEIYYYKYRLLFNRNGISGVSELD
ncbi:hypothetical protein [Dysgonomonas sp. 25]|uniref:hypothetical protein n=1 Tax=Dysgonomonas sp. 25 TaxID=2302933 RepID=UPI0013D66C24|nr:hypothetical protein [Dysgonomonas sp. 25]NDV68687.1 hypothetical protein [Dysgonomonas sp. 25]